MSPVVVSWFRVGVLAGRVGMLNGKGLKSLKSGSLMIIQGIHLIPKRVG